MLHIRFRLTPLLKDVLQFYGLVALTIPFVYYAPSILNKLYFLGLLAWFWKSEKNYFWFAFAFVLIQQPGGLFQGSLASDVHRVPLYNLVSGISFDFFDLFFILSFIKAWFKGQHRSIILKKPLIWLSIYLGFLFILSIVDGMSFGNMAFYLRNFSTYVVFISFPFLVNTEKDLHRFMYIVFPSVFIILVSQLYFLSTGRLLQSLFLGFSRSIRLWVYREAGSANALRPVAGLSASVMLVFFSYVFSMLLSLHEKIRVRQYYLFIISGTSFLIIFLSATRSWTVVFSVFLVGYILWISQDREKLIKKIIAGFLLFSMLYTFVPKVSSAVTNSLERISTLESLASGDATAGGTLIRITERLPKVLENYKKHPVFGMGFTDDFMRHNDYHVGNFNMMMHVGLVGFFFFLYFWAGFFRLLFRNRKLLSLNNSYRQSLLVLMIAFFCMLLLHFSSYQFFGYILHRFIIFFFILFFSISEFLVRKARMEEIKLQEWMNSMKDNSGKFQFI